MVTLDDAVPTVQALAASANLTIDLPTLASSASPSVGSGVRVYHVDAAQGDDALDGRAATSTGGGHGPWRTLARLLQADLAPGDTVELACGSMWHETLALPASGSDAAPIVVTRPAQNCTAAPLVDGGVGLPPSAWSPYRGHIWKASLDAVPLQLLAASGVFTVAHHPNRAESTGADPGSPYLPLAAASVDKVLTTGPDLTLPAGARLDSGARVRVRTNAWRLDESTVTGFDGTRITLAQAPMYTVAAGWGYLLVGQLWMLDSPGEWYWDAATRQLYAWMPDSTAPTAAVRAGTLATGIDLHGLRHVVVDGVAVRNVGVGVDMRTTTDVVVRNLRIEDTAEVGIAAGASTQDVIEWSSVARTGGDAITGWGGAMGGQLADASHLTVRNNTVRDSAVQMQGEQVTSLPRSALAAIFIGHDSVASGNVVVNAAYIGILTQTGGIVEDNFVYGACSVLDDCGGIYTSGDFNRSQIRRNTIVHMRGALAGQPLAQRFTSAQGIYLDDNGADMVVEDNTVIDADAGIQLHNARRNTVRGNRLYGNRRSQLWMQEDAARADPNGDLNGNVVQGNLFAPVSAGAAALLLTTPYASTARFATFDANRFDDRVAPAVAWVGTASSGNALGFRQWRGAVGSGASAAVDLQGAATSGRGYATFTVTGGNLVPNGALAVDSAGWSSWNATSPSGTLRRESCPAGACLRYAVGGSEGLVSSPGFSLQRGSWYRLSVDVSTDTDLQAVPLVVRLGSGDYDSVSDRDLTFTAGRAWGRHSVSFQATRTVDGNGARVDFAGLTPGRSIAVARLEIVPIVPEPTALASGIVVNAGSATLAAPCPYAATNAALCGKLQDLATDRPLNWPVQVPAHSALMFYALEPTLADRDGDGIPDRQDACPASTPGEVVDASGCEFVAR